jgi:CRP-like cAMP-binding protein
VRNNNVATGSAAQYTGNRLLDSLTDGRRSEFVQACELVDMSLGQALCKPDEAILHAYFPRSGYISLITPPGGRESLEVGLIGSEGGFGLTALLEIDRSSIFAVVQGAGTALRITVPELRSQVEDHAQVRRVFNRYLYVLMAQIAQTALCSRFHRLDARLARWLLMAHDRVHGDTFPLTHVFLGYILGARRAGVTTVASRLKDDGLITYSRGVIKILDRKGLEALSCRCYVAGNELYRNTLSADKISTTRAERRAATGQDARAD